MGCLLSRYYASELSTDDLKRDPDMFGLTQAEFDALGPKLNDRHGIISVYWMRTIPLAVGIHPLIRLTGCTGHSILLKPV